MHCYSISFTTLLGILGIGVVFTGGLALLPLLIFLAGIAAGIAMIFAAATIITGDSLSCDIYKTAYAAVISTTITAMLARFGLVSNPMGALIFEFIVQNTISGTAGHNNFPSCPSQQGV